MTEKERREEERAKAKAEAEEILKTLTSENFKDKAKELSQGPSAGNGGELGWFSKRGYGRTIPKGCI